MGKDKKARALGYMSLSAIGVVMGSALDAMRKAGAPNEVVRTFLDTMDEGFEDCLWGEAHTIMTTLVGVLRRNVAEND